MRGLLLTGGGARGAYQAGVLLGIAELLGNRTTRFPFPIVTGISAGAINAVTLAGHAPDFPGGVRRLVDLWRALRLEDVFRTDLASLAAIAAGWLAGIALGGLVRRRRFTALVDTSPLRALLGRVLDLRGMRAALEADHLRGVAVIATHYASSASVAFVESVEPVAWSRVRRLGVPVRLGVDHVMASTAIPLLFPAVAIDGTHYGDGALALSSPFSPAIHLGADRILAVGMRQARTPATYAAAVREPGPHPTAATLAASVLDAVFMDAIDGDLERLERINLALSLIPPEGAERKRLGLRPVAALLVSPSQDLGALARRHLRRFPAKIRYLVRGLGASQADGPDFLSYLLFDGGYCGDLIEMGRADALARRGEIEAFLAASPS